MYGSYPSTPVVADGLKLGTDHASELITEEVPWLDGKDDAERTGLHEMSRRYLQLARRLEGGDAFGIVVGNVRAGADLRLGLRKQLPISAVA